MDSLTQSDSLYWHGGKPGLNPGELVIPGHPHFVDGCPVCEAKRAGLSPVADPQPEHPDMIYMTHDRLYARFYASKYPSGDMYSVEPLGEVTESSEDPFPTFLCAEARVVRVYDRQICLTMKERRSLYRNWKAADDEQGSVVAIDWFVEQEFKRAIGIGR